MGKRLVAYFSAGGTTKKVAEMIANVSAKYSCGFSNLLDSSIIVNER